jgi:hypothetical protein
MLLLLIPENLISAPFDPLNSYFSTGNKECCTMEG